ncbi:hypothetical protein MXD81_14725, partial [Microbacteriaceae bacterium K1510]|nr:hypothetical protein [Microbacteriaceae bacterium K1510]
VLLASTVMGLAIFYTNDWLGFLPLWLHLVVGIGASASVYFLVLLAVKEPLVREVMAKLLKRNRSARAQ